MKRMAKFLLPLFSAFAFTAIGYASSYVTNLEVSLKPIQFSINGEEVKQSTSNEHPNEFYNGKEYVPNTILYKGTTYVPIRFLSEKLEKQVEWDGHSNTIKIDNGISQTDSFTLLDESQLSDEEKGFISSVKHKQGIYSKNNLYVIARGEVPNPGHGLEIVKQEKLDSHVNVYVKLTKPKPDMMYTQVISYPVIVGKINDPSTTITFINIDTGKALF